MASRVFGSATGLKNGPLETNPTGLTLRDCDNLRLQFDGVYTPRRATTPVVSSGAADRLFYSKLWDRVVARTSVSASQCISGESAATLTNAGGVTGMVEQDGIAWLLTNAGFERMTSATAATSASLPEGLDPRLALTGSSSWFAQDSAVGYWIVWGVKIGEQFYLGAPSGRVVIVNPSGSGVDYDVALTIPVPAGVTTSHFFQIYRTNMSSAANVDPGAEGYLVYEAFYVSGTTVSVTDQLPEGGAGATLYTSPSQEGANQANYSCPGRSGELTSFANCLWASGYNPPSTLTVSLLGVGGVADTRLRASDTVTVGGQTYTAVVSGATGQQFDLGSGGPTATNIRNTAYNLCYAINTDPSQTQVYAHYASGPDDLPGKIRFTQRSGTPTVASSRGAAWFPNLATAVPLPDTSKSFRLSFSKEFYATAWPVDNYIDFPDQCTIQGLSSLTSALLVWTDRGLFRVTGVYGNFYVDMMDPSVRVPWAAGAAVLNDIAYSMSTRGPVAATVSGSMRIGDDIRLLTANLMGAASSGRVAAHELDELVYFPLASDTLVFRPQTGEWMKDDSPMSCAVFAFPSPAGSRWYIGDGTDVDTDEGTGSDFGAANSARAVASAGYIPSAVSSVENNRQTVTQSTLAPLVATGDQLEQVLASAYGQVVSAAGNDILVELGPGSAAFDTANGCGVFVGFTSAAEFGPVSLVQPGVTSQARSVQLLFDSRSSFFSLSGTTYPVYCTATFKSEFAEETVTGFFDYVPEPDNGGTIRIAVPQNLQRASSFIVRFTYRSTGTFLRLYGMSVDFETGSERTRR